MTEILRSPPQQLPSTSISNVVELSQHNLVDHESVEFFTGSCGSGEIGEEGDQVQLPVLAAFLTVFRKSLVGCRIRSGVQEQATMDIGGPTNVRHVAHVTFDRFNGFLGLPVEFEPEVPRRPPSASTRVFGVSTESMQLSFDGRGNCVPTILLMMQRRLYSQRGLASEGIFRINPENGQEEYVREQLNNGLIPDDIDVHCLAGLIKAWFRELPKGVLDCVEAEQVMQAQSEEECCHIVRLLPPTEAALLDWAINLMADVAQLEHLNKMNARNVAMVFAPNMTQMSDPLTALMYAVQVMNFLKTLIEKTLRQREECGPVMQPEPEPEPSDDNPKKKAECEIREEEEDDKQVESESQSGDVMSCIDNMLPDRKGHFGDMLSCNMRHILEGGRNQSKIPRSKSRSWNEVMKASKKNSSQSEGERDKEERVIRRAKSCTQARP
ncbi:rho GTPase-activating protein 5-like [Salvia divinorum]|uniref:Rho GTPase-activating protein 5-like n=1 Tax=Salvia divinorum TaxID=28513 RepID=A0ABD1IJ63_SALDI